MRTTFFLFSLLLIQSSIFSQTKQENILDEAVSIYGLGQRADAIKMLDNCLTKYPNFDRGFFVRANWSIIERKYDEGLVYLEKLESINPDFNPLQKKLLAECYFNERKLDKATRYAKEFLNISSISPDNQTNAKNLLRNIEFVKSQPEESTPIKYTNLGREINTNFNEYFASTNADESAIYFTRKTKGDEDIWASFQRDGSWTPAIPVDEPEMENEVEFSSINSYVNDGAQTIAPSGRYLFFTSCDRPKNFGRCDLYFALIKGNEWTKPKILTPPVNTGSWESQPCISADGRKLYFLSGRAGGMGNSDIYVSDINTDGTFSEPKNLGGKINTSGREERPFIHPDGKTLYFSSEGHPGYGGLDLFMSRFENGEWQTPVNMGSQINSSGDEISIFINALGNRAYVSKQNNSENRSDFDIYTFELPEKFKPKKVTYIKGIITNAKTNQPMKASVKLSDIEKAAQVMSISSDEKTGDFLMTVVADKEYGFNVIKEGFAIYSQNYSFGANEINNEPQRVEIKLIPLETGAKFELRNVFFETAKFELKNTSFNELNYIVDILKANPNIKIMIGGHTDNVGNTNSNQLLSENRAKAVLNYLAEKGIAQDRLSAKGYGSSKPVTSNETEEGRAKNRRTEIEIL